MMAGDHTSRARNPFERHPTRRYAFAFEHMRGVRGLHLDLGCGRGEFLSGIAGATDTTTIGADYHAGYLRHIRDRSRVPLVRVGRKDRLPFRDSAFDTITLLDVLEHVADERHVLAEARRVLAPGGLLVCTVPQRHVFSVLDPDDAKFRWPRLHRFVYTARYGADTYHERFVDVTDGMRGDLDVDRSRHTNYAADTLFALLGEAGFVPVVRDGANLFGRLLDPMAKIAPRRLRPAITGLQLRDARFTSANLFVAARRA
jgi:SAM-dependent methyltransferase